MRISRAASCMAAWGCDANATFKTENAAQEVRTAFLGPCLRASLPVQAEQRGRVSASYCGEIVENWGCHA